MTGTGRLCFCALLCLLLGSAPALAAEPQALPQPGARAGSAAAPAKRAAAKAKKPRRAAKPAPGKPEKPPLTIQEITSPYSAMQGEANATRLPDFDPTPKAGPFAQPEGGAPVNLRISRERVIDPLTGKDVSPKADPAGARESLKGGDVKGAMDKLGGKAEVQVEILKF